MPWRTQPTTVLVQNCWCPTQSMTSGWRGLDDHIWMCNRDGNWEIYGNLDSLISLDTSRIYIIGTNIVNIGLAVYLGEITWMCLNMDPCLKCWCIISFTFTITIAMNWGLPPCWSKTKGTVKPGLINHGPLSAALLLQQVIFLFLNGTPPIEQPIGVYQSELSLLARRDQRQTCSQKWKSCRDFGDCHGQT